MDWEVEYRKVYFLIAHVLDALIDDDTDRAVIIVEDVKDTMESNLLQAVKNNLKALPLVELEKGTE